MRRRFSLFENLLVKQKIRFLSLLILEPLSCMNRLNNAQQLVFINHPVFEYLLDVCPQDEIKVQFWYPILFELHCKQRVNINVWHSYFYLPKESRNAVREEENYFSYCTQFQFKFVKPYRYHDDSYKSNILPPWYKSQPK